LKQAYRSAFVAASILCGAIAGFSTSHADKPDKPSRSDVAPEVGEPAKPRLTWTGILSEDDFKSLHELRTGGVPELRGEMIDLASGKAYLSLPKGEPPHPGIVVIQEWWGLNDNIKHWSDRLAADGYAALAVDLYDGRIATTPDEASTYMQSVEESRAYEILHAAFDFLQSDSRIRASKRGSVGWCFGGGWSLNLALAEPELDCAVVYYGRLVEDPKELAKIRAKVCGIFGNQDRGIPPEIVNEFEKGLRAAGVDHEIHRYDAEHAFANPSSARYDHEAAKAAWKKVRKFLASNLKS
jgi:carboxymethylenebutenolidase